MSTFHGQIKEIPGISVDRFNEENLNSWVYFLSHCHTDHMVGLSSSVFKDRLADKGLYIYTSPISKVILTRLHPDLEGSIKELVLEHPTTVSIGDFRDVSVTCVPAGHCPGSVMFLFETKTSRVLYTGDFRISPSDIKKFRCFYDIFDKVKSIDKVYLDTTFFMRKYTSFPKREHSLFQVCDLISKWISMDKDNVVKIFLVANYGYEYLFKEIYNTLKMPVHVDSNKYTFCSMIPELDKCVTTDSEITQIHCCSLRGTLACKEFKLENIRMIKVSAYRWENFDSTNENSYELDSLGNFYVCYSTHASYEESMALIEFIKPKEIHVCVERDHPSETVEIYKLVEETLNKIHGRNKHEAAKEEVKLFEVKELSLEQKEALEEPPCKKKYSGVLDSPPR
ncbi:protein artemis [Sitophilus oryzae]|uniref:Protein artemis n=1 Tax=Sitophilus oryzae TaxID=7048 RepID=A0A6J2YEP6_SITOR|nr:protein artemis [Sitophilus oryzae]